MATTVLTQVGEEWIASLITANATGKYVHWGTGSTAVAKSNTVIATPGTEDRVAGTVTQPAADKYQVVGQLTCNATGKTITEAGLFTASTGGTLLIRGDFVGVALNAGDKIEFTFLLEIT